MTAPRIGTAGWAIPRAVAENFPSAGTGLQRYAVRFAAAEINSTFYRSHRATTYARWREATPPGFQFSVKAPRTITHAAKLADVDALLRSFVAEVGELGDRLGPLLVQLPPSAAFDPLVADRFFTVLRSMWDGPVACEPRHVSWFELEAEALLVAHRIARVAADPAPHPAAAAPGGWTGLAYWRLHGSPRMYRSAYEAAALERLAVEIANAAPNSWCIFDNTASGAAAADALALSALLNLSRRRAL